MKKSILAVMLMLMGMSGSAADVYVSTEGKDSNDGSASSPKATLTSALRQAREMRRLAEGEIKDGITIHLSSGIYGLCEPVFV
ncbi:MAG: right-handed parallel beta-helix repeat-containing protein, partial [Muribaculaceae bacterium]|nr:right-handed parallel beta-helix repeat-containing protein [Muribaculaceae bacterium]